MNIVIVLALLVEERRTCQFLGRNTNRNQAVGRSKVVACARAITQINYNPQCEGTLRLATVRAGVLSMSQRADPAMSISMFPLPVRHKRL